MSTVKSKNLQVGTDATASNNFTIYQPSTPDGTLRIGVGNADSPTEVGRFNSNGYVATNAPAFSAYLSANQTISTATHTKVQIDTEEFDTNSNYDTSNYRFTPTVAGYYYITGTVRCDASTSLNRSIVNIFKNGVQWKRGTDISGGVGLSGVISTLIYLNGTTDYVELYNYISAGTAVIGTAGFNLIYFQGHLVQQA